MNHDRPSEALGHQLVARSHAEGVTRLALAVLIEADNKVLMAEAPDEDSIDGGFTLPADRVLPGEGLLDALHRVSVTTVGIQIQDVTDYFGHHNEHGNEADTLRTFIFGATVVNPQDICRRVIIGHQWVWRDDLVVVDSSVLDSLLDRDRQNPCRTSGLS